MKCKQNIAQLFLKSLIFIRNIVLLLIITWIPWSSSDIATKLYMNEVPITSFCGKWMQPGTHFSSAYKTDVSQCLLHHLFLFHHLASNSFFLLSVCSAIIKFQLLSFLTHLQSRQIFSPHQMSSPLDVSFCNYMSFLQQFSVHVNIKLLCCHELYVNCSMCASFI